MTTNVSALVVDGSSEHCQTVDHSSLDITGDIDCQVFLAADDWSSGSFQVLAEKWVSTGNQKCWLFRLVTDGRLIVDLSSDGSSSTQVHSGFGNTVPFANGEPGWVAFDWRASDGRVRFWTRERDGQLWTQLGSDQTINIGSLFNSSAPVNVGGAANSCQGHFYELRLWDGFESAPGTLVANPVFMDESDGTTQFTDTPGRTWDVQNNATIEKVYDAVTLAPDGLLDSTGYTGGALGDIDEDPGSPDAAWLTAPTNTSTVCRVSFPTPNVSIFGEQQFRLWLRKNASSDPTYVVELYEANTLVSTLISSTALSSSTGELVAATFDASQVTNIADVECRVVGTPPGSGNQSNRASVEVGAVAWDTHEVAAASNPSSSTTISVSTSLSGTTTKDGTASGGLTVDAAISGTATKDVSSSGSLSTSVGISATAVKNGDASGALAVDSTLSGSATKAGSASGSLSTDIALSGDSTKAGSASAPLSTDLALSGSATKAGSASGPLDISLTIDGDAGSEENFSASTTISVSATLSGSASKDGSTSGSLSTDLSLSGTEQKAGDTAGSLAVSTTLSGTSQKAASSTGSLSADLNISGDAAVGGTSTASVPVTVGLSGTASSARSASTSLPVDLSTSGDSTKTGQSSALISSSLTIDGDASIPSEEKSASTTIAVSVDATGSATKTASSMAAVAASMAISGTAAKAVSSAAPVAVSVSISGTAVKEFVQFFDSELRLHWIDLNHQLHHQNPDWSLHEHQTA